MTDKKMSDAEVVRSFECCLIDNCDDCPCADVEDCVRYKMQVVLDLINRKDAEIELLTIDVKSLEIERDALQEMFQDQNAENLKLKQQHRAEIEKLNVELVGMRGACESYKIHYDNAQAEIERLTAQKMSREQDRDYWMAQTRIARDSIEFAKYEAYNEFAERLHQNCKKYPYTLPSVLTNIEITYKELTEGGNEDGISKITNE